MTRALEELCGARAAGKIARWMIVALAATGCGAPPHGQDTQPRFGKTTFVPPLSLDTERIHLEPLGPEHAQSDYDALMACREHLRRTLNWGDWPRDDFTIAENRADLERHAAEFEEREAFAYTVQTADRSRCVGCIYLHDWAIAGAAAGVRLDYWAVESALATDLDRHLLERVVLWLEAEWGFDAVFVSTAPGNPRGAAIADEVGFERWNDSASSVETSLVHRARR